MNKYATDCLLADVHDPYVQRSTSILLFPFSVSVRFVRNVGEFVQITFLEFPRVSYTPT